MKPGSWEPIEHRPPLKPIEIVKRYPISPPTLLTPDQLQAEFDRHLDADRIWKLVRNAAESCLHADGYQTPHVSQNVIGDLL